MTLRIRHFLPLFAGALSLTIAALSFARGRLVVATVAAAAFGVILLALATYILIRAGSNYRQLRAEHEELLQQTRNLEDLLQETREIAGTAARIDDDQLLEVMDRMTPVITQTVARDWSINANRITARYEVIEAELRKLLDHFEGRAAEQQGQPSPQDTDDRESRAHGDRSRLGD